MKQISRWVALRAVGASLADAHGRGWSPKASQAKACAKWPNPKASQAKPLRPRSCTVFEGVLWFALCALALSSPAEWEHAPPPPGDEFLTNRLGRTWGEPIYNGYLLVNGQYIDAPYVVEQRGYVVFANGVRVENGVDVRTVLPMPEPPPVTEDPGPPTALTHDSSLDRVVLDPVYERKRRFWDYIGLSGEERVRADIEYLSRMPCVARVEDTHEYQVGGRRLILHGVDGMTMPLGIATAPRAPRVLAPDESLYQFVVIARSRLENDLRRGEFIVASGRTILCLSGIVTPDDRWRGIFETFAADMTPEEKTARLKALGLLSRGEGLNIAQGFYPLSNFRASPQLAKRLAGDESWKAEGAEMVRKLTNGWQRIEPAFRRAPPPESPKPAVPAPEMPKPSAVSTQAPPTVSAPTSAPPAVVPVRKSPAPPPPDPPPLPLVPILGALCVLAAGAGALLWARKRR